MEKLMAFVGMSVGGSIGWYIGWPIGIFTACMLSIVGTGVGLWGGRVLANKLLS